MRTKLFTLLLAVAASVGTMFAEKVQIGDLYYNLDATNQTAEVTSQNSFYPYWSTTITTVIIPSSVTYNSVSYSVTSIGNYAFYDCRVLTSVTIPNSVTSIGEHAFYDCRVLTSVTIPNSVTSIGEHAFSDCSSLTSLTIPNSVTSIGNWAFAGCTGLISPVYNAHVFAYMPTSYSGAYTIPDGIESIAGEAFYECTGLTSVTIPNSVTSIGKWAFDGCESLTSVTIPNSVTSIGRYAFWGCTGLTSINVASDNSNYCSVDGVLFNKDKTTLIQYPGGKQGAYTIPNSVTNIGSYAFYECSGLTSVTIGNSVTSIGDDAFQYCTGLTSVKIGNSVTSIGDDAFQYCTGLTSVKIGNSVTSIGRYAFCDCTGLTSVTIGNSVTSIGEAAFAYCTGLTSLTCKAINPPVPVLYSYKYGVFDGVDKSIPLYVPGSSILAYQSANQWKDFTNILGFAIYTISTTSANPEWGTTAGDTSALYLDEVEISATANYGYHFVKWNDNNISNPRTISVTEDKTYTATFAKNVYTITLNNAEHGTISGNTSAEYLDEVTLTANPEYGYHFDHWSDGNTDNPRMVLLTQDTTFTAEFAFDKSGTCGENNALTWSYDDQSNTLTINGNGALTENYTFGVEATKVMNTLVIGDGVTAIGDSAFYGIRTLIHLFIGANVATIGDYAFAECRNIDDVTSYSILVPTINATTFANIGNKQYIYLYVPVNRERSYKRDEFWGEFDIQIKEAETTTTDGDVVVVPTDNTAEISWPTVADADTYEIEITKDGVVVCVLKFNTNGQLVGIAFAPGRNGANYTQLAQTAGFKFTVTGLTSGTRYGYTVAAKDALEQTVDAKSGTFTTTIEGVTTDIDQVIVPNSDQITNDPLQTTTKLLRNGQILILRGDRTYTLTGAEVK